MKKILASALIAVLAVGLSSCSKEALNTAPTDAITGENMFSSATNALQPLNGVYRMLYSTWSTGSSTSHQSFGVTSHYMKADAMGEDFILSAQGSGWFWYECLYDVKTAISATAWSPYDIWNYYYTIIANVNYIIDAKETMEGAPQDVNYVIGQAYALRAFSYFMLAQFYCRNYVGHEDDPGVPIYTEPTYAGTPGAPRGTLTDTYNQIDADIDTAVNRLTNSYPQTHPSHIDMYVANGIKARICLVEERWQDAVDAARIAKQGGTLTADVTSGMHDVSQSDVLWGAQVIPDQSGIYASFFMHMVADGTDGYGNTCFKQINKFLYDKMGVNDIRREWWNPQDPNNKDGGYQQMKFQWKNKSTYEGDYFFMRTPEMYLIEAEALCMLNQEAEARQVLEEFMSYRDPNYSCSSLTGTAIPVVNGRDPETGSLREEIINQRRIELWGEYGRIFDIRRLHQGFQRTTDMGWTTPTLLTGLHTDDPESYDWVLTIPQAEFDGNKALNQNEDQNPMGSYK